MECVTTLHYDATLRRYITTLTCVRYNTLNHVGLTSGEVRNWTCVVCWYTRVSWSASKPRKTVPQPTLDAVTQWKSGKLVHAAISQSSQNAHHPDVNDCHDNNIKKNVITAMSIYALVLGGQSISLEISDVILAVIVTSSDVTQDYASLCGKTMFSPTRPGSLLTKWY